VAEVWSALGALAVVVAPLALAAWLLARSVGRGPRGKMPRRYRRKTDID
jgi:hypothetical protein